MRGINPDHAQSSSWRLIPFPPANAQEVLFEEVGGGTALAGVGPSSALV
jgi:hypothetical protein